MQQRQIRKICDQFQIYGDYLVAIPYGSGHINDTFQVTYDQGGVRLHYTLQRVNTNVFKDPVKVMENIDRVTAHMLHKIRRSGLETKKRTIRLIHSLDGKPYVIDADNNCWRCYIFIENARTYDVLESERVAYKVAQTFGEFQLDMVDLPGGRLHETIPNFHNTPARIEALKQALQDNPKGRAANVQREVDFILSREEECGRLLELHRQGLIPERITHNDTKVNNILIDDASGEGICVIDLDTVMPGLVLYDFGDLVRTCTSPAEEDEVNLDKVFMRFDMFEALLRGYLASANGFLTPTEREELPFAGKLITLEIATRFLTDYLQGDVYFKTHRVGHNLDRCRNQIKLVQSIEEQFDDMHKLLQSFRRKTKRKSLF